MEGRILVGTSNWSDHRDYYPPGIKPPERIRYYAQHFPIVEVDSTYYTLQPQRNFQLWCDRTPPGFVFDVKAYREMTQHNRTPEGQVEAPSAEAFERFSFSLQPMRDCGKLRAVLLQFPPWFKYSEENKEYLALCREMMPDDLLAVEFRHRSWFEHGHTEEVLDLLEDLGMVHVMVDEPNLGSGTVPPVAAVTNPALAIVRFHGRNAETWYKRGLTSSTERFKYLYSRDELSEWLPRIEEVRSEAGEIHLLMNNNYGNYAVRNAIDMMDLLGLPHAQLDLPGEQSPEQPQLL